MALRSLANRLPAPLRQRAYSLTPGGAAFRRRQAQNRGASTNAKPVVSAKVAVGAGVLTGGLVAGQYFFGSADNFYDHRFITKADPDAMAEFYGNEDFMEIFCVFPFMVDFMMRSGHFDDAGHVHTFGLPGSMEVSMQFEEYEEDTTGDGENDTVTCFNKQERFHDTLFGFPMWDMVQNFGFKSNGDGTTEVYHYGERIRAPFPIRLIFQIHAMYVIWATEQHVNSERFLGKEETTDEEIAQRHNIPFHLLGQFMEGLQADVEVKLGQNVEALRALNTTAGSSPEKDEAVMALLKKVEELESTLTKLKEAQTLRRNNTAAEAGGGALRPRRFNTAAEGRVKPSGSVEGMYKRALQRRETAAEEEADENDTPADQVSQISGAIQAAIKHVENAPDAKPQLAAIQRRVTGLQEAAEEAAAPAFSKVAAPDSGEDSAADADEEDAPAPAPVAQQNVVSLTAETPSTSMPITYAPQQYPMMPAPQPVEIHVHIHNDKN